MPQRNNTRALLPVHQLTTTRPVDLLASETTGVLTTLQWALTCIAEC